jgi:hypothetical protein
VQLGYRFYFLACAQLGGNKSEIFGELKHIVYTLSQELNAIELMNKSPYLPFTPDMPPLPTLDYRTPPPIYPQLQQSPSEETEKK